MNLKKPFALGRIHITLNLIRFQSNSTDSKAQHLRDDYTEAMTSLKKGLNISSGLPKQGYSTFNEIS